MNPLVRLFRLRTGPSCREVAQVLQSFLDGELGAEQAERVESHLSHCERCGIDARVHQEVTAALARLRGPDDDDAVARLRGFATGLQRGQATDG